MKIRALVLLGCLAMLAACDDDKGSGSDGVVEDTTVEDTTVEDTTVEDTTVEDTTVEDTTVEDTTVEDTTVEDTTVEDTTVEDTTVEDTTVEDTTVEDTTVEDTTLEDTTMDDTTMMTAQGETCDDPFIIAIPEPFDAPIQVMGDTTGAANDYFFPSSSCPGTSVDGDAVDHAYQFTAPAAGIYTFVLSSGASDLQIYALTDCAMAADSCLGGNDSGSANGDDTFMLTLAQDDVIFLIVDGFLDGNAGTYTLSVGTPCTPDCSAGCGGDDSCGGTCGCASDEYCDDAAACQVEAVGESCGNPFVTPIVDGAAMGTGSTLTSRNSDTVCTGTRGDEEGDQAWQFTDTLAGEYRMTMTPNESAGTVDAYLGITVGNACETGCATEDDGGSGPVSRDITIENDGDSFYVQVDGWAAGDEYDYTIEVCSLICDIADGETCGTNACGLPCGCEAGETCTPSGLCSQTPGNQCSRPRFLDNDNDGTYSARGVMGPDLGLSADYDAETCPDVGFASGSGSLDLVFQFDPPAAGTWEITAVADSGASALQLYVFPDADCDAGCLDRSSQNLGADNGERISVTSAGSDSFFIVVDSIGGDIGAFTVEAGPPCVPDCSTSGACSVPDGCLGTCACADGFACDTSQVSNTCVLPTDLPGNTCALPNVLAIPDPFDADIVVTGDTSGATNEYNPASGSCPSSTTGAGVDLVYSFTAPADGAYTVTLDSESTDLQIYALTDCADEDNSCIGSNDSGFSGGIDTFEVTLGANDEIFLIVDSFLGSNAGAFELSVSPPCLLGGDGEVCPSCGCAAPLACQDDGADGTTCRGVDVGETCGNPFLLDLGAAGFARGTGDTSMAENLMNVCNGSIGDNEPDQAWRFDGATAGRYRVTMTPDETDGTVDTYIGTTVGNACMTGCLGEDDGSSGPVSEDFDVPNDGDPIYVQVDAWSNGDSFAYEIEVCSLECVFTAGSCDGMNACGEDCTCAPGSACSAANACELTPGDTCDAAIPLTADGDTFTATGTISGDAGSSDQYNASSCTTFASGDGSVDGAFLFTAPIAGVYDVTLTPATQATSPQLYAFPTAACNADCIARSSANIGSGNLERIEIIATADGEEFYLVVDGTGGDVGDFTITVSPPCIPDCSVCGPTDGCGSPCLCADGEFCDSGTCATGVAPGEDCADPLPLDVSSGSAREAGDTRFANNDMTVCGGTIGDDERDQAWELTGTVAGDYRVTITPDETEASIDAIFGAFVGNPCTAAASECTTVDDGASGPIEGTVTAAADGDSIFIQVEGFNAEDEYAYTIEACSLACEVPTGAECATSACGDACGCNTGVPCAAGACMPGPGDTCGNAFDLVLDTPVMGDTSAGASDYDAATAWCPGYSFGGINGKQDQAFRFVAPSAGEFVFTMSDQGTDLQFYVVTDCADIENTCLGGADDGGVSTSETLSVTLTASQTVFVIVDAWSSGSAGAYTMTATMTAP